jgi:hypothetical protein
MNKPDSMAKNMPKIAEVKLSSCGFKVADFKKNCNCGVAVAKQHFFKVAELRLRKCFLQVAELRLRTQKKVALAHLCIYDHCTCYICCICVLFTHEVYLYKSVKSSSWKGRVVCDI